MAPPPTPVLPPVLDVRKSFSPANPDRAEAILVMGGPSAGGGGHRLEARFELKTTEGSVGLVEPRVSFDLSRMRSETSESILILSAHRLLLADEPARKAAGKPLLLTDGRDGADPEVLSQELDRVLSCPLPRKGKGKKDAILALASIATLVFDPRLCETSRWARLRRRSVEVVCRGPGFRQSPSVVLSGYTPHKAGVRLLALAVGGMGGSGVLDGWMLKSTGRGGTRFVPRELRLALQDSQSSGEALEHRIRAADWGADAFKGLPEALAAWEEAMAEFGALLSEAEKKAKAAA